ncbi:MAG: GxxExxY protein [Kiritimatiellae bacterium]|nr:GxxExxY protein [Kiritimatiellia bacterium]
MHPLYLKAAPLTQVVVDSAVEVQNHLGIGLLESIYQKCLMRELSLRGHAVRTEVPVTVRYKGWEFPENLRIDLFVDDCLVVECKALEDGRENMVQHKAQTLSYMKLMDVPLGLVLNFGNPQLRHGKRGIARVILKGADAEEVPF